MRSSKNAVPARGEVQHPLQPFRCRQKKCDPFAHSHHPPASLRMGGWGGGVVVGGPPVLILDATPVACFVPSSPRALPRIRKISSGE